jgi:hypothetical protein
MLISIDRGSRTEFFMNSSQNWYYAAEVVLGNEYFDWEFKSPGLGDLRIYRMSRAKNPQPETVASFPKGTWEYARLLIEDENADRAHDRDSCPKGCFVKGFAELSDSTQRAHMEHNH